MALPIPAKVLIDAGLSRSFAHHVVGETRSCSLPLAIWLKDNHGIEVPPLVGKTKREIDLLRQMYPPALPKSVAKRIRAQSRDKAA